LAHNKRRKEPKPVADRADPLIGPGGKLDPRALRAAAGLDGSPRAARQTKSASAAAQESEPESLPGVLPEALLEGPEAAQDDGDDELLVGVPRTTQKVVFTLARDLDKRLDKYLVDRITFLSRAKLQALIDVGGAKVNGRVAKASTNLRLGDVVEVEIEPPPSEEVPPQDIALSVLFEDEHMIVLNKSPDIIVHPARSHLSGTLINALAFHFQNRSSFGGHLSQVGREYARPGVVHRLDRQTSGVIVFAKSEESHWKLGTQFEHRQTDKRYVALVHGRVDDLVQTVDVPIGPHPSREKGHREKQVVRHDHLGKPALSVCRVLGRYCTMASPVAARAAGPGQRRAPAPGWSKPIEPGDSQPVTGGAVARGIDRDWPGPLYSADSPWLSVVEVELKTGRTHQIRVHMQHLRHPLAGDDMYQGRVLEAGWQGSPGVPRVALHAAMLKLRHPITQKPMEFRAPFPADLGVMLAWLRARPLRDEPRAAGRVLNLSDLGPE